MMRFTVWVLVFSAAAPCNGEDWSRFRGPNGSGLATDSGYPVEFSKTENTVWRTAARKGKSSPVLTETRVFITAFEDEKLYTQCFDRATGELLWEQFEPRTRTEIAHWNNEPSASSPVTDGENAYVFFHDFGLISYDPVGEIRWSLPLGPFTNAMGHAASLILSGDSVILLADQAEDGSIASYSTSNGELNWKAGRGDLDSWSTPMLYEPSDGEPQIITATRYELNAHSAATGEAMWAHGGTSMAVAPSPVMDGDTVYSFGYGHETPRPFNALPRLDADKDGQLSPEEYGNRAPLIMMVKKFGGPDRYLTRQVWDTFFDYASKPSALVAVRLGPTTQETEELWRYERSFVGVVPSLIVIDRILYLVKNGGILTAFDAETGDVVKAGRITGAVDPYSASPVSAEGRIYFATEGGNVAVVKAGRDWSVIAVNALDEPMFATPALSGGHIYVRTEAALYRFGVPH